MTTHSKTAASNAVQAAFLPPLTTLCSTIAAHRFQSYMRVPLTHAGTKGPSAPSRLFLPATGNSQHQCLQAHTHAQPIEAALQAVAQEIRALIDDRFAHTLPDFSLQMARGGDLLMAGFLENGVLLPYTHDTPVHIATLLARAHGIIVRDDCPRSLPPLRTVETRRGPMLCPGRDCADRQYIHTRIKSLFSQARKSATQQGIHAVKVP